jgi:hypothetical protein
VAIEVIRTSRVTFRASLDAGPEEDAEDGEDHAGDPVLLSVADHRQEHVDRVHVQHIALDGR